MHSRAGRSQSESMVDKIRPAEAPNPPQKTNPQRRSDKLAWRSDTLEIFWISCPGAVFRRRWEASRIDFFVVRIQPFQSPEPAEAKPASAKTPLCQVEFWRPSQHPLPFFGSRFPYKVNQPPKKATRIQIWLLGYQVIVQSAAAKKCRQDVPVQPSSHNKPSNAGQRLPRNKGSGRTELQQNKA